MLLKPTHSSASVKPSAGDQVLYFVNTKRPQKVTTVGFNCAIVVAPPVRAVEPSAPLLQPVSHLAAPPCCLEHALPADCRQQDAVQTLTHAVSAAAVASHSVFCVCVSQCLFLLQAHVQPDRSIPNRQVLDSICETDIWVCTNTETRQRVDSVAKSTFCEVCNLSSKKNGQNIHKKRKDQCACVV